jgi:hypothetical protein
LNYPIVRAHDTVGPYGLKSALLAAWEAVSPRADSGVIPPWTALAGVLSVQEIVARVVQLVEGRGRFALVLEEVDRHQALYPSEVRAVADLAEGISGPVIVTSRAESNTAWRDDARIDRLALRDFDEEDVMACLLRAPEMAGRRLEELAKIVDFVAEGSRPDRIPPIQAYTRVALAMQ